MNGHTYTHTYTQDNYSNPRCACAPRVNNYDATVLCMGTASTNLVYLQGKQLPTLGVPTNAVLLAVYLAVNLQ